MEAAVANAAHALTIAHTIYARNETATDHSLKQQRSPVYKVVGIVLAISSGVFIGISFVLKKVGLLKANVKYNEEAGEGYGYLKNAYWWGGMTLMIIGEICNFGAYAFVDAVLVTPMGALSVVITAILSAIFLKERLSMVGKVACFLCIVGSVIIAMNAPESSVATIQEMQGYVIAPGFLAYAGVIIVGSIFTALWAGPRYGKKNMFVYLSICSWVGALSVTATMGIGAACVAAAGGTPQFNQWFFYVLLVFVIATLLTEIIYLNKALNLFNAAMVTPTYYVYFTSTTIMTSAILFQGFKGTVTSIITVVNGFLTICSGVVLLQLSKSAKDVPDAAVFSGDLDQIHTIAEQAQPETDPKADAIRGTAAIVRRFSTARQKMEEEEFRKLQEEKQRERLETVSESGQPEFEWDGLRRRKTGLGTHRHRAMSSPSRGPFVPPSEPMPHLPLGWSHFPTEDELEEHDRPSSPGVLSSIAGTIRSRARSVLVPNQASSNQPDQGHTSTQNPAHPVQLTEINLPTQHVHHQTSAYPAYGNEMHGLHGIKTEYQGSNVSLPSSSRRIQFGGDDRMPSRGSTSSNLEPPVPPPHGAKRQFSFQNVFKRHQQHGAQLSTTGDNAYEDAPRFRPVVTARGYSSPQVKEATEEERLGLVKGDSSSMPALPSFADDNEVEAYADNKTSRYSRGMMAAPTRSSTETSEQEKELEDYEAQRARFNQSGSGNWQRPEPDHSKQPPNSERDAHAKSATGAGGSAFL